MLPNKNFIDRAIQISIDNIDTGGGPFGAVIVKDGEIISEGANRVSANNDPTAHAEVSAIRTACETLKTFKLTGCEIYTSCEPCPMCLAAIYWAGIERIYFANTKQDADNINFSDKFIYDELALDYSERKVETIHLANNKAIEAFVKWENSKDKIEY